MKWVKHQVGHLYERTIFVELPDNISGQEQNYEIARIQSFIEIAHRLYEFRDSLKKILW